MLCNKCSLNPPIKHHDRHLKDGRVLSIRTNIFICEHRPPNGDDRCYPKTDWANRLCKIYPERVVILRDCGCNKKKVNHHPDYKFPFQIEKLCYVCHWAEHRRLRLLAADAANDSSKSNPEELISINAGRGNMNPLNANLAPIMQRT